MVCATEFQRGVVLFGIFACVSFVDSRFQRMTCSTPTNPFKPGNPFTPVTDSSLGSSEDFESPRRRIHSANPFASENQLDNSSADLFIYRRKLTKPVKNPADYDGTQSLRDYLKQFERCSVFNGWSKDEAAIFLAASLRGEPQKVLNGMCDNDCRNYARIVEKLELRISIEKQRELHQECLHDRRQQEHESIQALTADIHSMSSLAYQDISSDIQERFAVNISSMLSKTKTIGCDYAEINHAVWTKPCHFVSRMEIGEAARWRFALRMKLSGSMICLKLIWKCYVMTFNVRRRQETQQVTFQQLVQQIQQLTQSMCLNTPASCYPSRCWYCKSLAITVVTAQNTSIWNKSIWVRETTAGCFPRARGMPEWE